MTGPTHAVIGLAATVAIIRMAGLSITPFELLLMLLGSLAPDIDGAGSITQPGSLFKHFLSRRAAGFLNAVGRLVAAVVRGLFGHRGVFHWPLLAAALIVAGLVWDQTWLFWFGWGYFWHVVADFCTKGGVPLWGPFSGSRVSGSNLRVGSWQEGLIFCGFLAYVFFFGPKLLPEATQDALNVMGIIVSDIIP